MTGIEIATEWAKLPPEHLQVALKALNPQLEREHLARIEQMRISAQNTQCLRQFRIQVYSLWAGFFLSLVMLGAAVFVGVNNQPWLALGFSGPSLLALTKIFVLRRSDSYDMRAMVSSQRAASSLIPPDTTGGSQAGIP
ncbi:hypothetical protein [Streptomyces herbicida]|uniref:hypothetical protein n=1 Tax=Streptomyces herbicida TaxID=3065675 RepID=UPI00293153B7|nr:hypothetical protein [Streptomyces sp. NEAU-HV9]